MTNTSTTTTFTCTFAAVFTLLAAGCDSAPELETVALAHQLSPADQSDEEFLVEALEAGALEQAPTLALAAAIKPAAQGSAIAAITQQIVMAEYDYAYIELVTVATNPHLLSTSEAAATIPEGIGLLSLTENVNARACPPAGSTCKQRWNLFLDISDVCELDGAYQVDFTVGCAPGADCSQQDPSFTEYAVPFTLDSENFCYAVEVECPEYAPGLSACTELCPCVETQGDCDNDDECAPGFSCTHDVGADYGLPSSWDVCLHD